MDLWSGSSGIEISKSSLTFLSKLRHGTILFTVTQKNRTCSCSENKILAHAQLTTNLTQYEVSGTKLLTMVNTDGEFILELSIYRTSLSVWVIMIAYFILLNCYISNLHVVGWTCVVNEQLAFFDQ